MTIHSSSTSKTVLFDEDGQGLHTGDGKYMFVYWHW